MVIILSPDQFISDAQRTKSDKFFVVDTDMLHAAMGLSTEAGEFLDIFKKSIFYGKPVDLVNADEEIGDALWYIALYLYARGRSFESVMQMTIMKLRRRFPDAFTMDSAINRNIEEERIVLERNSGSGATQIDD